MKPLFNSRRHLALLKSFWWNSVAAGVSPAQAEATGTVATTENVQQSKNSLRAVGAKQMRTTRFH
jgi:hypothetical protein